MRRSDKEIKDLGEIDAILQAAPVCRIAMVSDGSPYIIPVNFAVQSGYLYFHSAKEGKKIALLRKNASVCFETDLPGHLVEGEKACSWGMNYQSVIGCGQAYFVEDAGEKRKALNVLMTKYAGGKSFSFSEEDLDKVCVMGIRIEKISGKKSG